MGQTSASKNALLSVYDKATIVEFAKNLIELGWTIYASGGTAATLLDAKLEVTDVSKLVGGKAILGHRVVTLSREISAGLLADKNSPDDLKELDSLGIPLIDLVCVDLYPLEEAIAAEGSTLDQVIEKTDIGGPTMLRAAAKGRRIVVSSPDQRQAVITWLKNDRPDEDDFLKQLAASAEYEVARYALISAQYLSGDNISGIIARKQENTKYGENPQQSPAGFYADNRVAVDKLGLDQFEHVKGAEKSYVNMTDIDRLLQSITHAAASYDINFHKVPAIAIGVKHGNACGAGVDISPVEAIKKMLDGDTRAIFGGVIMLNSAITKDVAETLMHYSNPGDSSRLLDGVIGASVGTDALELLSRNKLRVVANPALSSLSKSSIDTSRRIRPVRGGLLEQPNYQFILDFNDPDLVTNGELSDQDKQDLILAWAIGSTSNSNTISIVKNGQLIGNGVGQQDRVGAAQLALTRTTNSFPEIETSADTISLNIKLDKAKVEGSVAYSDSFFPFADGPELLAKAGIKTILASSGSIGDQSVIDTMKRYKVNIAMIPDKKARGFYMH